MNQEEKYTLKLINARNKARLKAKSFIPDLIAQKMVKAVSDKESWVWPFAFMLAIYNDLLDIGIIGSIPIFGDIIDFAVWAILFAFTMSLGGKLRLKIRIMISLTAFFELIPLPFIEILPIWTLTLLWGYYRVQKMAEIAELGLRENKKGKINREALSEFT